MIFAMILRKLLCTFKRTFLNLSLVIQVVVQWKQMTLTVKLLHTARGKGKQSVWPVSCANVHLLYMNIILITRLVVIGHNSVCMYLQYSSCIMELSTFNQELYIGTIFGNL